MNGTSAKELYLQYFAAHNAIEDAITVLAKTAPHGRDYYPQGDMAINLANAEHQIRMTRLKNILTELEELALHCMP
jgi:hypothetical protein